MITISKDFLKNVKGDTVEYWYDVTEHLKRFMGEILKSGYIYIGHIYNDDTEDEICRREQNFCFEAESLERGFENSTDLSPFYALDLKLIFVNSLGINICSTEGFCVEKI